MYGKLISMLRLKFSSKTFYLSVIAVLAIIILIQRSCGKSKFPCPDGGKPIITTVIDTQYVDHTVVKTAYKPGKPIYVPGTVDSFYKNVDTLSILRDYYASRVYNDTVTIDSIGYAYILDTISKNAIQSRKFKATYKIPVITKETTVVIPPKKKFEMYAGFEGLGFVDEPLDYFGLSFVAKTKKDKMYTLGFGASPTQGIGIKAGLLWKIKF